MTRNCGFWWMCLCDWFTFVFFSLLISFYLFNLLNDNSPFCFSIFIESDFLISVNSITQFKLQWIICFISNVIEIKTKLYLMLIRLLILIHRTYVHFIEIYANYCIVFSRSTAISTKSSCFSFLPTSLLSFSSSPITFLKKSEIKTQIQKILLTASVRKQMC